MKSIFVVSWHLNQHTVIVCRIWSKLSWMLNDWKILYRTRLAVSSVSLQLDQVSDCPSKQLNTCCKIRSYNQAFIKWLKMYVVLFVNQTLKLKKSLTHKCLLCKFYLIFLHLSVGGFNVIFLRCCGGEITYCVQQRSIYYIFCTCTSTDASVIFIF